MEARVQSGRPEDRPVQSVGGPVRFELRFSLTHPDVSTVVIGLAELAHLEEALAAQAMGPLPDAAVQALEPVWASNFGL